MIRSTLEYHRPASAAEASTLLQNHSGNVAVVGGGTQLLPRLTRDEETIGHLVDLAALGLADIVVDADQVVLGSRVTYNDVLVQPPATDVLALLHRVASGVTGGRQLRNLGTLVGSACFAMPGSDMPGVLAALEAVFVAHGVGGEREIEAADFFVAAHQTALLPGEFVHRIRLPRTLTGFGYCKVKHSSGSWPIVTATATRRADRLTVTLGSVESVPLVVDLTDVDADDPAAVTAAVTAAVREPWSDVLAPGTYRVRIAGPVAVRALNEMTGRKP